MQQRPAIIYFTRGSLRGRIGGMSDLSLSRPTAREILKAVFWNRWGKIVGAVLTIFGVLDFIDAHFAPRFGVTLKAVWDTYYVLPSFGWRTWIVIIALSLLVVAIHGAYAYAMGYSQRWEKLTEQKLIFEIDLRNTRIGLEPRWEEPLGKTLQDDPCPVRIMANIQLRFENKDTYPLHMKGLTATVHRYGIKDRRPASDIFTWFALLRVTSHGLLISNKDFEGMAIAGRQLSPAYLVELMLAVQDDQIKTAADLDTLDYIILTMESSGYQEPVKAYLHPYWKAALEPKGTDQITVTHAPSVPKDYRRIGN